MKNALVNAIKNTPLYHPLRNAIRKRQLLKEYRQWVARGRPSPPAHLVKQQTLREHAERYGLKNLVETGTLYGDMVEAMRTHFKRIYSIELSRLLFEYVSRRFKSYPHITIIHGDSGEKLQVVMQEISEPTLFWLDGHYCAGPTALGDKETPIFEELGHLFNSPDLGHVIIIDDARNFGTNPAYPTLDALKAYVQAHRPNTGITVQYDSIRIVPKS